MAKKRKTTTKAKRRQHEPLPDAHDHDDTTPGSPIHCVPALSGGEVLWFEHVQGDSPAPPLVRRAPIIAWNIAPLDGDDNFVEPVTISKHGSFYVISYAGQVFDPSTNMVFESEVAWIEHLKSLPVTE